MSNIEEYLEKLLEADFHIEKAKEVFARGPLAFCVREMVDCHKSLFDRFCPFKVGDRVALSRTPFIDDASGWSGAKHFLIKGALATVTERGYRDGMFVFSLIFDDDSWFDHVGSKRYRKPSERLAFVFAEDAVRELS